MLTRPRSSAALIGLAATLNFGCGSDGSSAPKTKTSHSTRTEPVADAAVDTVDPNAIQIDIPPYQLGPGEEREYVCYTMTLPADAETVVTQVRPIYGKGIHHLGVYQTLAPEPDGQFDCPELFKMTWLPIYGGGVGSGPLSTPANAGYKLPAGTQILVQIHLLNTSDTPIEDKTSVVLKTDDSPDLLGAGVYGFDNRTIHLPANTLNVEQTMDCSAKHDMDVFAVFGHMHRLGTTIEISRGANVGDEILYKAAWTFNEQPVAPMTAHIKAADTFHIRCTYDNTSAIDVNYGERTQDEMCTALLFYTPYTAIDGCLKTPPP
jgi:hypothetical protein